MSLWVELPHKLSSRTVFDAALKQGILVSPGLLFSNSNRFDHFLRINCGAPYSTELDQALRCLGRLVAEYTLDGYFSEGNEIKREAAVY